MARNIFEKNTCKEMIDPTLEKAGWFLRDYSKVKIEIPVIIPPLPQQEQFAVVVRQAESARQGEGLFQSLLNQNFRP